MSSDEASRDRVFSVMDLFMLSRRPWISFRVKSFSSCSFSSLSKRFSLVLRIFVSFSSVSYEKLLIVLNLSSVCSRNFLIKFYCFTSSL